MPTLCKEFKATISIVVWLSHLKEIVNQISLQNGIIIYKDVGTSLILASPPGVDVQDTISTCLGKIANIFLWA